MRTSGTGPDIRLPCEPANRENSNALVVGHSTSLPALAWTRASNDDRDDPDTTVIRRMARVTIPDTQPFVRCVAVFGD